MTTLLKIVQDIMSDMSSDDVNSISDTIESTQVANIVEQTFDDIVDIYELEHARGIFDFNSSPTQKVVFAIPSNVRAIETIKYDVHEAGEPRKMYKEITYVTPDTFLSMSHSLNSTDSTTETITFDTSEVFIANDEAPRFWTSFNGQDIVFNSYDSSVDGSGLVEAKLMGIGMLAITLTLDDTTPINLPPNLIGLLRNESKAMAFELLKDGTPAKVEQSARRTRVRAARNKHRFKASQPPDNLPNYGRGGQRQVKIVPVSSGTAKAFPSWWKD